MFRQSVVKLAKPPRDPAKMQNMLGFIKYPNYHADGLPEINGPDQASFGRLGARFKKALKNHESRSPGIIPSIRGPAVQFARGSELRGGDLVGEDEYGNRYYQNDEYTLGRNKWVIFADRSFSETWDYDSTQIPAEWHRWLTSMTNKAPVGDLKPVKRVFALEHNRIQTGKWKTQYMPSSTTRYKIDSWDHTQL